MRTLRSLVRLFILLVPLTGCVGIGGEQIALMHEPLAAPSQRYTEKLSIQKPADDLREEKDRIGRATITVFAITSGSITTTSPVEEQVVEQIRDALASLGYQADLPDSGRDVTTQVAPLKLKVALNEIWFKNYNWFFPMVPTWGDMKVTLVLENAGGRKLFEKSYEGGGNSLCLTGHCAFETATKEAMTEVLNKITKEFSSQSVRDMITAEYKPVPVAPTK